jgi:hypothetical protein
MRWTMGVVVNVRDHETRAGSGSDEEQYAGKVDVTLLTVLVGGGGERSGGE